MMGVDQRMRQHTGHSGAMPTILGPATGEHQHLHLCGASTVTIGAVHMAQSPAAGNLQAHTLLGSRTLTPIVTAPMLPEPANGKRYQHATDASKPHTKIQ